MSSKIDDIASAKTDNQITDKFVIRIKVYRQLQLFRMNKYELQSKIKSTGTAILFWFLLGAHFAYLNKWGLQIIFWLTLGGLGVWALIELFLISGRVAKYNQDIYRQIDELEKRDRAEDLLRSLEKIKASGK